LYYFTFTRNHPQLTSFPTRRSSDLDPGRNIPPKVVGKGIRTYGYKFVCDSKGKRESLEPNYDVVWVDSKGVEWTEVRVVVFIFRDRKSTRLNSSHQIISYAVFCLKK